MANKMHAGAIKQLYQRARDLRNNATHAEDILWNFLRTKPCGFKFRRQHPYSIYILDFYCHSLKLVIEVDGSIHELEDIKRNDLQRQGMLEKDKLFILRFTNEQVERDLGSIIKEIEKFLLKRNNEQER